MTKEEILHQELMEILIEEFCENTNEVFRKYKGKTVKLLDEMVFFAQENFVSKEVWTNFHQTLGQLVLDSVQFKIELEKLLDRLNTTYFE